MKYTGTTGSAGIAIGKVYLYQRFQPEITMEPAGPPDCELLHYRTAQNAARKELEALRTRFSETGNSEQTAIFAAQLEILLDETIDEEIRNGISSGECSGAWVIHSVFEQYAAMFEGLDDPIIQERAADLRDICVRLLRCWADLPEQNLSALPEPVIIVAHDLLPSDTATLDRKNTLGILTETGGGTSHSAIIARAYEIPAVLGVSGIVSALKNRQEVILDAINGKVLTNFSLETRSTYESKRQEYLQQQAYTKQFIAREPVTPDNVRILVELNIASAAPQELEAVKYTDGAGLFRSEFLYMGRSAPPTEEEQFQAYRKVLMAYNHRPVILRTLDIGGDKPLACLDLPKEENPFLGERALRLCFRHPEIFHTQLRAALRASSFGQLWLMFPMVSSMEDLRRAKACLERAKEELRSERVPFREDLKTGMMIEVPSIALLADQAAKEADFASIGTNDLIQYLTAADRGNPAVSDYYQAYHPAVFRLIRYVARYFAAQGKPVGVCGEMGGNLLAATVLIGLGIRQLSVGAASVAAVKQMISSTSCEKAEELAKTVCGLSTAGEVYQYLREKVTLSHSFIGGS